MYTLYKKTTTTGCEMEDGSDTREADTRFVLVKESEMDDFSEHMADDYGNQDYSYQVSYTKQGNIGWWELVALKEAVDEAITKTGLDLEEQREQEERDILANMEEDWHYHARILHVYTKTCEGKTSLITVPHEDMEEFRRYREEMKTSYTKVGIFSAAELESLTTSLQRDKQRMLERWKEEGRQ